MLQLWNQYESGRTWFLSPFPNTVHINFAVVMFVFSFFAPVCSNNTNKEVKEQLTRSDPHEHALLYLSKLPWSIPLISLSRPFSFQFRFLCRFFLSPYDFFTKIWSSNNLIYKLIAHGTFRQHLRYYSTFLTEKQGTQKIAKIVRAMWLGRTERFFLNPVPQQKSCPSVFCLYAVRFKNTTTCYKKNLFHWLNKINW